LRWLSLRFPTSGTTIEKSPLRSQPQNWPITWRIVGDSEVIQLGIVRMSPGKSDYRTTDEGILTGASLGADRAGTGPVRVAHALEVHLEEADSVLAGHDPVA